MNSRSKEKRKADKNKTSPFRSFPLSGYHGWSNLVVGTQSSPPKVLPSSQGESICYFGLAGSNLSCMVSSDRDCTPRPRWWDPMGRMGMTGLWTEVKKTCCPARSAPCQYQESRHFRGPSKLALHKWVGGQNLGRCLQFRGLREFSA